MGNELGKDGSVTKFCESLPVIGYVASAGHAIAGDTDRAKRAAAAGTNGTVSFIGAVGGGLVGGPVGAIAGAGLGSAVGQLSEHAINERDDVPIKTDKGGISDMKAGSFFLEMGASMVGSAAGGTVGKGISRQVVGKSLKEVGGGGVKRYVTKRAVESAVNSSARKLTKKVGAKSTGSRAAYAGNYAAESESDEDEYAYDTESDEDDECVVAMPVYKVHIKDMDDCPAGMRRLTIEEVIQLKQMLVRQLNQWDIIKVAGGKIDGYGYGNKITAGHFDNGWGWVFLTQAGFHHYDKVKIDSLEEIPTGWRRLTVEEARSGSVASEIRSNLGTWDIWKLAGGKFDGPGYGSKIHQGYFDKGCGWVVLVSE